MMNVFPEKLKIHYEENREAIKKALQQFSHVKRESYFYELCYCLCTPQSKAIHAETVVNILIQCDFRNKDCELEQILGNGKHYIRFHKQKSISLQQAKENWGLIEEIVVSNSTALEKREYLVNKVRGLGMKESSHFLRNIGTFGLAIIDRHVLKHLVTCGVFSELPVIRSMKDYYRIERQWFDYCGEVDIKQEEMDLVFWSYETGFVLK